MDPAILSATAGLIGSLVGGVSTFAASWLTQRGQLRMQTLVQQAVKREALYAEFIVEASKRVAEAWSHQAESPDAIPRTMPKPPRPSGDKSPTSCARGSRSSP